MRLTRLLGASEMKYFQRYVEWEMNKAWLRRTWSPLNGWKEVKKTNFYYGEHRPWTEDFKRENAPGSKKQMPVVQPIKEWKFFKGDRVEILVGKDKGKQGLINCIIKERNWCFVESLNCEYKQIQQNPLYPPSCVKDERPLLVTSQVKLVDPSDELPTDVEWRFLEDGKRVRVSTRTGRVVPTPSQANELSDFVLPATYHESDTKDTKNDEVKEVTFKAKLMSFDDEILESTGTVETRKRGKVYAY